MHTVVSTFAAPLVPVLILAVSLLINVVVRKVISGRPWSLADFCLGVEVGLATFFGGMIKCSEIARHRSETIAAQKQYALISVAREAEIQPKPPGSFAVELIKLRTDLDSISRDFDSMTKVSAFTVICFCFIVMAVVAHQGYERSENKDKPCWNLFAKSTIMAVPLIIAYYLLAG